MFKEFSLGMLISLLVLITLVTAQPGIPHQFWGSVSINGNPAPNGALVTAKIDGSTVAAITTSDGGYGAGYTSELFKIPDPHGNNYGKTIEFFVNNVKAAEYIFENGDNTQLDLSVTITPFCGDGNCDSGETCSSCPADCGQCSEGGGGGPTGGTYTPPCEENWICSDWFDCFNERQSRVCTDLNQCGTNESKPAEVQDCVVEPSVGPDECNVGETICEGSNVMSCSPDGEFVMVEACQFGCADGVCNPVPEGYNESAEQPPANPIGDFFNWLGGLFGGGSITGAVTAEDSGNYVLYLFGVVIIVMIIIVLALAWKFRNGKKR